jgi:hypothetical protein
MWTEVNDFEFGAFSHGAINPMCPIDAYEIPDGPTNSFPRLKGLSAVKVVGDKKLGRVGRGF